MKPNCPLGTGGGCKKTPQGQPHKLTSQKGYRMAQRESVPSLPSLGGRYGFVQRRGWTQMSTPSRVRSPCRNGDPKSSTLGLAACRSIGPVPLDHTGTCHGPFGPWFVPRHCPVFWYALMHTRPDMSYFSGSSRVDRFRL